MTEEEQRIAIAELCGAQWVETAGFYRWLTFDYENATLADVAHTMPLDLIGIPNYVSSLDAARQAVFTWMGQPEDGETLSRSRQDRFEDQLEIIGEREQIPLWMLGPAEWCEALLRATNRWVD